jgi:cytochrome b561
MDRKGLIQDYSVLQKSSHWAIAVLCVLEFPTAVGIQRSHLGHVFGIKTPVTDMLRAAAHEWGGWLILALVIALLVSRVLRGAPSLPHGMRLWQRWAAHGAHAAIYLGLIALVASGAAAMHLDGRFAFLHIALAKIGVGLIAIHVAAALWHQGIRRDDLIERMLPASGRVPTEPRYRAAPDSAASIQPYSRGDFGRGDSHR